MSTQKVKLKVKGKANARFANGVPTPIDVTPLALTIGPGDEVTFFNQHKEPLVLAFEESGLFGVPEYTIPAHRSETLQIDRNASPDTYLYRVRVEGDPPPRDEVPCIIIDPGPG